MQRPDVVALAGRIQSGLPIRLHDAGEACRITKFIEGRVLEYFGRTAEKFLQGLPRIAIEVHEDQAFPGLHAHRREAGSCRIDVREGLTIRDTSEAPVGPIRPRVIGTDELLGTAPLAPYELQGAVRTDIVECVDDIVLAAYDQQRGLGDFNVAHDPVAFMRDLGIEADIQPHVPEYFRFFFEAVDREVMIHGHAAGPDDVLVGNERSETDV